MIKSKIIDFFKKKTCDACTSIKLEKHHENPKIKDYEKQLSKTLKVTYNEFEKI